MWLLMCSSDPNSGSYGACLALCEDMYTLERITLGQRRLTINEEETDASYIVYNNREGDNVLRGIRYWAEWIPVTWSYEDVRESDEGAEHTE